ncbi:neutral zinc metallopeptidase [Enemella sp. A6]|uniref:neutral zinc metallopeptidase n=1 Tax=Enemella sp. A6 TaxID=3440152 RepID=UPI003EB9943E
MAHYGGPAPWHQSGGWQQPGRPHGAAHPGPGQQPGSGHHVPPQQPGGPSGWHHGGWQPSDWQQHSPPPRKGPNPALITLLVLSVVAVVALVVLLLLLSRPESGTPPTEPTPAESSEPTEPTPSDDPGQGGDPNAALTDNPIYPQPLPEATTCRDVAAAPTDTAGLKTQGEQWVKCLSDTWAGLLADVEGGFRAPDFQVFTGGTVSTACGDSGGAFYCSSDETIYLGADDLARINASLDQSGLGVSYYYVVSHEYHHHVQQLSGMIDAMIAEYQSNFNEGSRRLELQDQCWVSMALRSAPDYDFTAEKQQVWKAILERSTSPQHGDSTSTVRWGTVGLSAKTLGDCNTWTAPSNEVS